MLFIHLFIALRFATDYADIKLVFQTLSKLPFSSL